MTGFRMLELELTSDAPSVQLSEGEAGVSILVRRCGRPVGFVLHDAPAGALLPAAEVARVALVAAAEGVVADALRDELTLAADAPLPTVSIAICTHDRTPGLERCLASIARLRERSSHAGQLAEVLVVDNAPSSPATRRAVEALPWVRYVLEPKPGLDFARNAAWRSALGDFVAYVDDDVVLDHGWLDGLMRALRAHPDAGVVTGLVLPLALRTEAQVLFEKRGGFRRGFLPARWRGGELSRDPLYPLGAGIFGAGANMTVRREALQALGGFDEALDTGRPLPGGGDLDMFYRTLVSGRPLVYEPTMAVHHEHRETLAQLKWQYYTWGLGFFAFLEKVWRAEPGRRRTVWRMVRWWVVEMLRLLKSRIDRFETTRADMIVAEIEGGLEGALGEYGRSRRRVERIRRKFG